MVKKQDDSGAYMVTPGEKKRIGKEDIAKAATILKKYRDAKQSIDQRIIEEEQWWKLRHWQWMRSKSKEDAVKDEFGGYQPTSAWLFNSVTNKHADFMDNYPEPNVLPREEGDQKDAQILSQVLPVILERNDYEGTYSDCAWYKIKHGISACGVFWNVGLENGLGDIETRKIDILNLFWEPGITDIQDGRNLFIVQAMDNDLIKSTWPDQIGANWSGGDIITVGDYIYDDTVDKSEKSVVVDWYYKVNVGGRTMLHFCKFVGDAILFATQNEPQYRDVGLYEHGVYPVVMDVLYPEDGTPVGFGIIAVCKDPQMYIDKLSGTILRAAAWQSANRHWMQTDCGVNKEQFLNLREPIVEVEGSIDEQKLKPIAVNQISGNVLSILQMKQDELKETSSNRDVSQGSSGGVTAASAIAALQEAGNKGSRDMISTSYRAYTQQIYLCIELIRQFYDQSREFRVIGDGTDYGFVQYSNQNIKDQEMGVSSLDGAPLLRRPVFDIKVKPQRRSTYSKIQQNELAKELFALGAFNPEMAQQVMPMVEMMEFDGKDQVLEKIRQGQTLQNALQQMRMQMDQMAMVIQELTGRDMGIGSQQAGAGVQASRPAVAAPRSSTSDMPVGERIATRARTSVEQGGEGTLV